MNINSIKIVFEKMVMKKSKILVSFWPQIMDQIQNNFWILFADQIICQSLIFGVSLILKRMWLIRLANVFLIFRNFVWKKVFLRFYKSYILIKVTFDGGEGWGGWGGCIEESVNFRIIMVYISDEIHLLEECQSKTSGQKICSQVVFN